MDGSPGGKEVTAQESLAYGQLIVTEVQEAENQLLRGGIDKLPELVKKYPSTGALCFKVILQPGINLRAVSAQLGKEDAIENGDITIGGKGFQTVPVRWHIYDWMAFGVIEDFVRVIRIDSRKARAYWLSAK